MSIDYTATPTAFPGGAHSSLENGDVVNRNNLVKETSPGAKPYITLALLLDYVSYIVQASGVGVRTCPPVFLNDLGASVGMITGNAPADSNSIQMFEPPHGATLSKATLSVDPANATPPAGTKVQGKIFKRDILTNVDTQLGSTVTDPTSGASYGNAHTFDVTCSEVIDRTIYIYYIVLVGEAGSGAGACVWYGSTYTVS